KYLLETERHYKSVSEPTAADCENLKEHIHNFQHERLIHLIVTCLFAAVVLYSFAMMIFDDNIAWAVLSVISIPLEFAYTVHYFHLENGVQRLYKIYDEMKKQNTP
ncbi:MAG: hypothetical protein J1F64_03270, partial [Oscillospiraceae bacterium]|nr:hypothetical protein [Oscillospiraceae bacterium]